MKTSSKKKLSKWALHLPQKKKGLVITLIFIAFILTTGIHKIDIVYGFVLFAALFFFPGIKIGTPADIKSVNYSLVF